MTDGPGAASGDRAASSREPFSRQAGPWQDRHAEEPDPVHGVDPDPVADPMAQGGPAGPAGPAGSTAGSTADPSVGTVPGGTVLTDAAGLAAERDEYLGALQRLQADFENYRKRVLRQQEEQSVRAALDLVGKVLPVLDTLDLARAHLGGAAGAVASEEARALEQARSQLLDVLTKEGLERVDEAGVEFDPVVHDAVAHAPAAPAEPAEPAEPADAGGTAAGSPPGSTAGPHAVEEPAAAGQHGEAPGGEGSAVGGVTVDEVLRAGYRWRGQVLRPAMVRVRG